MTRKDLLFVSGEDVDEDFCEPFIEIGYRRVGTNLKESIKSIFRPNCNEFGNVWSHVFFIIFFTVKYWFIFTKDLDIFDPFVTPLFVMGVAMTLADVTSALAHTFNSTSRYWRHKWFHLDYAGISVYGVCFGHAFYSYCRPLQTSVWLFSSPWIHGGASLLVSITTTFLCSMGTSRWLHIRTSLIGLSLTMSYVIASSPYMYRLLFCEGIVDCDVTMSGMFFKQVLLLVSGVFPYVIHFPERCVHHTFDCVGNSHNWMHILTSAGMAVKFEFVRGEMNRRRTAIVEREGIMNSFTSSVSLLLVAVILNLIFGFLIKPGKRKEE